MVGCVCAFSGRDEVSAWEWRASMWCLVGDGRVMPCARGSCKVSKRSVRYKVANRNTLFLWFIQRPSDLATESTHFDVLFSQ